MPTTIRYYLDDVEVTQLIYDDLWRIGWRHRLTKKTTDYDN